MRSHFVCAFLPGCVILDRGSAGDYMALSRFHYLNKRPATWAAIVAARYVPDDGTRQKLIGVAVLSHPSLLHRARHRTFGLTHTPYGQRIRWVNANLRTISRVIVHPQFRSIGLSTALIGALTRACPTRYIEASARMGAAHPLFDRAGFMRVDPIDPDEPVYFWRDRTV